MNFSRMNIYSTHIMADLLMDQLVKNYDDRDEGFGDLAMQKIRAYFGSLPASTSAIDRIRLERHLVARLRFDP